MQLEIVTTGRTIIPAFYENYLDYLIGNSVISLK